MPKADRIVHLEGINRPLEPSEFMAEIWAHLDHCGFSREDAEANPVIFFLVYSAELENDMERKASGRAIEAYSQRTGAPVALSLCQYLWQIV